ncbi:MAG: hypothetical protein ACD_28C00315G0001, partial [uncultured bacterium]
VAAPVSGVQNPLVASPQPVSGIPSDERMLSALGYIPMLFVGPLIMKPRSKFCQMHGKQAMIVTILSFFTLFMLALMPAIGSLLFLGMIGTVTLGMYQAYSGVEWKMPIVYDIAMKVDVDSLFAGTSVKPAATTPPATPVAPTVLESTEKSQATSPEMSSSVSVAPPVETTPNSTPPSSSTPNPQT